MHRRPQLSKGKPGVQPCINIKKIDRTVLFSEKCRSVCKGYRGQDKSYILRLWIFMAELLHPSGNLCIQQSGICIIYP